jgi:hypothetical protein
MSGAASPSTHRERDANDTGRAQSSVVGVALLLGATVVALGVLTASVGTLVDGQAARTDADRVAADFEDALRPVETTGHRVGEVRFAEGHLTTVERDLQLLVDDRVVRTVEVGGLVYERGDHRVASVAGAVVRERGESERVVARPPIFGSAASDVLVVGAAKLNASGQSAGGSHAAVRLTTNVSHERHTLGTDEYAVAVETESPAAFERAFAERDATITRRDVDGDGTPSVVATFPGDRRTYLVVHDMRLEVGDG